MTTILFLHGWQSVPGGVKPTYLAQHGHRVINPKLPDEDFEEAVRIAQAEFNRHKPDVVVGSSRGGAVVMNIKCGETPLVLLCPAWKRWGTAKRVKRNTVILHSKADDVVPFADSEELVRNSRLPFWTLIETGDDHRLADPDSLELMLIACSGEEDVEEEFEEKTTADLLEEDWYEDCYGATMNWIRVAPERDWAVVHGTVWSLQCGKRIDHAWCERDQVVVDLTLPVGLKENKREKYYGITKAEVRVKYSTGEALALSVKNRHAGPWDEPEHVREQDKDAE